MSSLLSERQVATSTSSQKGEWLAERDASWRLDIQREAELRVERGGQDRTMINMRTSEKPASARQEYAIVAGTVCVSLPPMEPEFPTVTIPRDRSRFVLLKQWVGQIDEVTPDSIWATLHDDSERGHDEIVEIPLSQIPIADRQLLRDGATFYWSIGYVRNAAGTETRVSDIRMKRNPLWTQHHLDSIKRRSAILFRSMTPDAERNTASS